MAEAAVTEAKTKLSYLVGGASLFFAWLAMGRRPIAISDENGEAPPTRSRDTECGFKSGYISGSGAGWDSYWDFDPAVATDARDDILRCVFM